MPIELAGSWIVLTLGPPTMGTGGGYASLALDGNGDPRISYYTGATTYDLVYAYRGRFRLALCKP